MQYAVVLTSRTSKFCPCCVQYANFGGKPVTAEAVVSQEVGKVVVVKNDIYLWNTAPATQTDL